MAREEGADDRGRVRNRAERAGLDEPEEPAPEEPEEPEPPPVPAPVPVDPPPAELLCLPAPSAARTAAPPAMSAF